MTIHTAIHTVKISGKATEATIYAAMAAALEAGCTHYRILAPMPQPGAGGRMYVAATGRATPTARHASSCGEAGGNPIDRA